MNTKRRTIRAALFGATGLVGGGVLRACLAAPEVEEVVAVTRRPLGVNDPKLREVHHEDFGDLRPIAASLADIDASFYCLGISASQVDKATYRVITLDYALEAARALREASPSHTFHFVSGAGTSVKSRMNWARVKGETEEALKSFGLSNVLCYRPGMVLGDRAPRGLSWILRAGYAVMGLMRFFPSLSINAESIGHAMIELELEGQKGGALENLTIRAAAERYLSRSPKDRSPERARAVGRP